MNFFVISIKLQIAQNLHKVTKDLVKNFMDNLLDKIQTSANLHFKKMTKKVEIEDFEVKMKIIV